MLCMRTDIGPLVPCQWNLIWGTALCIQLYMFSLCTKSSNTQIQGASHVNATGKFAAVLYWGSCVCGTWWQKDVPQIHSHMKTSRHVMKAPRLYPTWRNSHQQHLPLKWCLTCWYSGSLLPNFKSGSDMIKNYYCPMLQKLLARLRSNVPVISLIASSVCMMMFTHTPHVAPTVHNQLNTTRWEMLKILNCPIYIPGFSLRNLHIFGPALKGHMFM